MASDFDRGLPSSVCGVNITWNGARTQIGWVTGFRVQESFSQFPIEVLGDVYMKTAEMTRVRVSGSFDKFRIYRKPLSALDGRPWPQQRDTLSMIQQYLSELTFTNIYTGEVVIQVEQFRPTDRSITISADSVMMENCSWIARRMIEVIPRLDVDATAGA
jgi:hypothetical protein